MSSIGEVHPEPIKPLEAKNNLETLAQATKENVNPSIKDTIAAFNTQKPSGTISFSRIPTQIDQPVIPIAKEVPSSTPPSKEHNPYYNGAYMTSVFIVMQEMMALSSDMRAQQDELRRLTLANKFEAAMASAELTKDLKMNQAFQSLTSAIGSGAEVVIGASQLYQTKNVDGKATEKFNQKVIDDNADVELKKTDLNTAMGIVGTTDENKLAEIMADPTKADNYDTKKVEIDKAIRELKNAEMKLDKTQQNEHSITSTFRQNLDSEVQLRAGTLKSLSSMITQAATAGIQMSGAALEQVKAEQDAAIEMMNSYMQGQEQAVQQARSALDEIKRSMEQMTQSYASSLSSRA